MPKDFGPIEPGAVLTRWSVAIAMCVTLAGFGSNASAQSDPTTIVTVKSEDDEKPSVDEKHPLFKLLTVAYKSKKVLESINDYECEFAKKELVGKKLLKTTMHLKYRENPTSVYLKFLDMNMGREVIYVQGQNGNNLLVHEAGFKAVLGTFTLSPTSSDALAENRYPITSIGLKNMLTTVIKQWEAEGKFGGITAQKRPESKLGGQVYTVYEAVHAPFKEFKYHTTRLWIDDATGMAIGVQQLAFPGKNDKEPPLVEEYFYTKIKTNLKLTDADFDRNNSSYTFK